MCEIATRDRLVAHGQMFLDKPRSLYEFTHVPAADALLNDLDKFPHAFVLACVMDRQIKAEKAWIIPHLVSEKLGNFSFDTLTRLSRGKINDLMTRPKPLHRLHNDMSKYFHSAVQRIANHYAGDAARIWRGEPSSAEVVYRFLEFDGVGPKIATMATNILARNFKIPFADYYSIDISADVHVRRVFNRLGLCPVDATVEQITYKAKALYPLFPGIMDKSCWEIGRSWCHDHAPQCGDCYMSDLCPTALRASKL